MRFYFLVKRLADIFFSILLIVSLSPLFFIIAALIYFHDKGPVIFKQIRIGKNGVDFCFYKFRSMPVNTPNVESCDTSKLKVTRFGKLLRRTNLDELPQFYNVLVGDMSFIGPRPPIPTQTDLIFMRKVNGSLALQPGLTGWAQVNSYDGMTPKEKANFDGVYAHRISLFFDLYILLKTVVYFTKRPPTY